MLAVFSFFDNRKKLSPGWKESRFMDWLQQSKVKAIFIADSAKWHWDYMPPPMAFIIPTCRPVKI